MNTVHLEQARALLTHLTTESDQQYGFGSMSCALYDSAWVSRIQKQEENNKTWLFPECFQYVLASQQADGSWPSYASPIDGVLNTASALLALHSRSDDPDWQSDVSREDIPTRITSGTTALAALLNKWDVLRTEHVGFELLVPALLESLEQIGTPFHFPGKAALLSLQEAKLRKFKPEMLYGDMKLTALHSLEAFVGKIDFDRLTHQKSFGSMMASPSSTAAYLMNASKWDVEAEAYLRHVVKAGPGHGSGGVPSAYPSTYFEYSWILSTLLKAGFTEESLGPELVQTLSTTLVEGLLQGQGTLGFARSIDSDADDTAKAILALNLMGKPTSPEGLVKAFEVGKHFMTYPRERDSSFSVNCNVLEALLHCPNPAPHTPQIEKTARFVYNWWYKSNDPIRDKWNLCPTYSTMLMSQALMSLLRAYEKSQIAEIDADLVQSSIPLALFQALSRTLQLQNADGSWGSPSSKERTAYSLLTIAAVNSMPAARYVEQEIVTAMERGRLALKQLVQLDASPEYLWIEKVTYSSTNLNTAYILAALNVTSPPVISLSSKLATDVIDIKKVEKFVPFYNKLLTIGTLPAWRIRLGLIEGCLFGPLLKKVRFEVFPARDLGGKEETYWDNIRFTWCCVNNLNCTFASADFLVNWMTISYLNYQADEYMEAVVATRFSHDWESVHRLIDEVYSWEDSWARVEQQSASTTGPRAKLLLKEPTTPTHQTIGSVDAQLTPPESVTEEDVKQQPTQDEVDLQEIRRVLKLLDDWTFTHPQIIKASEYHRKETKHEMKMWIKGHLIQAEDSHRLAHQKTYLPFETPTSNFYHWVSHVSADHTSCPYAYELLLCILSDGEDLFPTAEQKYYSARANRHLSTLCRMENDYGSVPRDRRERNVNSVDFPEFRPGVGGLSEAEQKAQLLRLAQYERESYQDALTRLDALAQGDGKAMRKMQLLRVMTNVTDSWGQMYVFRDLGRNIETITEANSQQLKGDWALLVKQETKTDSL